MTKISKTGDRSKQPAGKLKLMESNYQCACSLRQDAHQALKDEFEAAQKKSRAEKLSLEKGIYQGEIAHFQCYRFEVPKITSQSVDADRPHAIEVHGTQVDGSIRSVSEKTIDVAVSEYYGRVLPLLDVVFDLSLLIDLVDRRLCDIDRDEQKYNIAMPNKLFGLLDWPGIAGLRCNLDHSGRGDGISLTEDQVEAVRNSLAAPFTLIWGPPGTGKTKTLIGVIAELLFSGKKVLFASNTNSAIDNVLENIHPERKCPYPFLEQLRDSHSIVRIGAQADELVRNQFAPRAIAEQLSADIKAELEPLNSKFSELHERGADVKALLIRMRQAREICSEWHDLQTEYRSVREEGGVRVLQETLENVKAKRQEYESAVSAVLPSVQTVIADSSAAYEAIRKLRERVHYASLLKTNQTSRLSDVRQQLARTQSESDDLQSSWLKRKLNKSRLTQLQATRDELRAKEASLAGQLNATETKLSSLVEKEASLMGDIERALSPLQGIRESAALIIQVVGDADQQETFLSHDIANSTLFADDRELLQTFLEDDAVTNLQILFAITAMHKEENQDPLQDHLVALCTKAEKRLTKARSLETQLQTKAQEFAEACALLQEHEGREQSLADEADQIRTDMDELAGKIAELEERLEKLEDRIVDDAQLLCVTMIRANYDARLIAKKFDALVVDEFSMVSLPQLYCAAALVKERVILSGDHLQLPPISQSTSAPAQRWMKSSFYDWHEGSWDERRGADTKGAKRLSPFMAKLEEQRRLPEPVSALVRPWYEQEGNSLSDNWRREPWEKLRPNSHSLLDDHIRILDTTETNAYSSRSSSGSHYNLIHAGIAAEVCRELIEEYGIQPEDILLIAPYRDQASLCRVVATQLCDANIAQRLESRMLTIHKSQGKGCPIVIYDLTDGVQKALTGFHKQEQPNLVNVALTRTEAHLILLCSYDKMEKALKEQVGSALAGAFNRLTRSKARIINAKPYADRVFRQVDISDLLEGSSALLTEEQKNSILVLNSATYYQVLKEDFQNARESILIVSPFVTRNRMDKLMPMIEEAKSTHGDDIRIELITRPPEKMFKREGDSQWSGAAARQIMDRLVALGAVVTLSPDTHGKLVVFDGRINYWGSLNPLSFRDTDEINTRLDAKGLSKKLIQLARAGRSWPYRASGADFPVEEVMSDCRAAAKRDLNDLAWKLAGLYKRPRHQLMWRRTIDSLVTSPPTSWVKFRQLPELRRKGCVLRNHLEQIEDIVYPIRGERLPPEVPKHQPRQPLLFGDEEFTRM